jgi:hypothetical protein
MPDGQRWRMNEQSPRAAHPQAMIEMAQPQMMVEMTQPQMMVETA